MSLLLATPPVVEIGPGLAAVAALLVTTGAGLTARSWYVTRHSRREWEFLDDQESADEADPHGEEGTGPATRS